MTRIDHAGKARQILAEIPDGATEAGAMAWCAEAQVHATLALVEQQRIANLIALANSNHPSMEAQVAEDAVDALTHWNDHENTDMGGWRELRPDIAAALGLTAGQEGKNDEG